MPLTMLYVHLLHWARPCSWLNQSLLLSALVAVLRLNLIHAGPIRPVVADARNKTIVELARAQAPIVAGSHVTVLDAAKQGVNEGVLGAKRVAVSSEKLVGAGVVVKTVGVPIPGRAAFPNEQLRFEAGGAAGSLDSNKRHPEKNLKPADESLKFRGANDTVPHEKKAKFADEAGSRDKLQDRRDMHKQHDKLPSLAVKADSLDKLPHGKLPNEADKAVPSGKLSVQPLLPLDALKLPDHVDGLRMEHDGHLNHDYKREILLGSQHGEFDSEHDPRIPSRLKIIFNKADKNHDGSLVQTELKTWILTKVQEHLDEAHRETDRIFKHLDADKDGFVTWREFHVHFLLAKGHGREQVEKHAEDYDTLALDAAERERIIRYKFRWAEADEEPQDNRLTRDELQNFRHPEQSPAMLSRMVRDIVENLDHDGDDIITEEEFVALPREGDGGAGGGEQDSAWQEERRREFRDVIDLNSDGKVDLAELKIYVDPHNANHAELEADTLMQLADENSDKRLSMDEVLDNAELFFGSKVVNAGNNFHDEF